VREFPERHEKEAWKIARPVEVLEALSAYLRDALYPKANRGRIPKENRRFCTAFGDDCDVLLESLGFTLIEESSGQLSGAQFWVFPKLPEGPSPERAFLEDFRDELFILISKLPLSFQEKQGLKHYDFFPTDSKKDLQRCLAYTDYDKVLAPRRTVDLTKDEQAHYPILGALSDYSDDLIIFSYKQQIGTDPGNSSYYFDSLSKVSEARGTEKLQMELVIQQSMGVKSHSEIREAYVYLGVEDSNTDEQIIGNYKSRISDIGPSQVPDARRMLKIIGEHRNSASLLSAASEGKLGKLPSPCAFMSRY